MRRWLLLSTLFLLLIPSANDAVPIPTAEYGTVPVREYSPAEDQCHLRYYNICSGWVFYWQYYCGNSFYDGPGAPMWGTCFDLSECPGDCRHLEGAWWAMKCFHWRNRVDIEVYCADEQGCLVGPPLVGVYDYHPNPTTSWHYADFGLTELCPCEELASGKFAVVITYTWFMANAVAPYTDHNPLNIQAGCEAEWRCGGTHSFVYRNALPYCEVYGQPGPMWASGADYGCTNYPLFPPECHGNYYNTGCYTEFLIDVYVTCEGATETDEDSWGEVKRLYK